MFFVKSRTSRTRFRGQLAFLIALSTLAVAVFSTPSAAQGVLRIAAVVNEDVISAYELNQRVLLVLVTSRVEDTPDNRRRLSEQILRNMIDEQLQLQEAKRLNVRVSDEEVDKMLAGLNAQNKLPPGSLESVLQRAHVDVNVLRAKLRADESWNRVLRNKLQQQVYISDEEVDEELKRLKAVQNLPRHHVAEIYLPLDNPDNERQVRDVADRLMQQIRGGANFSALAREFSQSASAAVGGDLGWVTKGQLDPQIDHSLESMSKGQVAGPIQTLGGFHILLLIDRVVPSRNGDGDVRVDYTQVILPLPADAGPDAVKKEQDLAEQVRADIRSCDDMRAAAKEMEAPKSGDVSDARLKDLPATIRDPMSALDVGQTTQPIRVAEGFFLATLCGRSGGGAGAMPSAEDVRNRLGNDRFNMLIRRYMRDLRQTAFVDIRG
jgi:peptidyl-prolyl cis-trans isomerase SurA